MPVVKTEGGEDYTGATVIEPEKGLVCSTWYKKKSSVCLCWYSTLYLEFKYFLNVNISLEIPAQLHHLR